MDRKTIGFLGFDGVQGLDLVGPLEAFVAANEVAGNMDPGSQDCYKTLILGLKKGPFVSETGITIQPDELLEDSPNLDTLIIPGGRGMRNPETCGRITDWLIKNVDSVRRIASVCVGIYALAPTGFLDDRPVTTHWYFVPELAERFPKLRVDGDAIFIKSGKYYTSAGITAGIDLALALVEEDLGPKVALRAARELVVYMKRPGGQEQFSEPLQFQVQSSNSFSELTAWIRNHLRHDLTVETLAAKANLCPRHFSRRFKGAFGTTPAVFVETLRLSESRSRLTSDSNTIEEIGHSVGFKSAKAFRRAFERRFGVSPSTYRRHFAIKANGRKEKQGNSL